MEFKQFRSSSRRFLVAASCSLVLGLGHSVPAQAGNADEAYKTARKAYSVLKASRSKQEYRHHWMGVIQQFQKVYKKHPKSHRADDARYMVGTLYYDLYGVSYLRTDLNRAAEAFQALVAHYPKSNLADDGQFYIGKIYRLKKKDGKAYIAFRTVVDRYPRGDMRKAAQRELAHIKPPAKERAKWKELSRKTSNQGHTFSLSSVKHWSNPDYTRIAIYVSGEVEFSHNKLSANSKSGKPPRIYIDLRQTEIGKKFANSNPRLSDTWEVPIGDGLLKRARVGQFTKDIVRVVLDLDSIQDYQVIPLSDPFRILIDIHGKPGASRRVTGNTGNGPSGPESSDRIKKLIESDQGSLATQLGLKVRTVVIDPGHGGHDTGAIGPRGVREKDVVLEIAKRVEKQLTKSGLKVVMTRTGDTYPTLEERTAMANQLGADLFVSIHANASSNHRAGGTETYFLDTASDTHAARLAARENAMTEQKISDLERILTGLIRNAYIGMSAELGSSVQKQVISHKKRGVRLENRGVKTAPFYVLLTANMPAVLIETAFISNPKEEKVLKDPPQQEEIAQGIAEGIRKYISTQNLASGNQVDGWQAADASKKKAPR